VELNVIVCQKTIKGLSFFNNFVTSIINILIKEELLTTLNQSQDETNESVYKSLLLLYSLNDESMKAKFLWKRLPTALKKNAVDNQTELFQIWSLVQLLVERKYSQAFSCAYQLKSYQWSSEELGHLARQLVHASRERLFDLLNVAYSSISVKELANLLSSSTDEALKAALAQKWSLDETKEFLVPVKKGKCSKGFNDVYQAFMFVFLCVKRMKKLWRFQIKFKCNS